MQMGQFDSHKDKTRHKRRTRGLVGYWGHSFKKDDGSGCGNIVEDEAGGTKQLHWQFQIERQLSGGLYAVTTFSWWDGSDYSVETMTEKDLTNRSKCWLYPDRDSMVAAYERLARANKERRQTISTELASGGVQ
jgi:hypothetical protein